MPNWNHMTDRALVESHPSAATSAERARDLFVRMWALAHVTHICAFTGARIDTPWELMTVVAAMVVLLRPHSGAWLAVLAVAQLADMLWEFPHSADHWILVGLVNLALLLTMARRRSLEVSCVTAAMPAARILVIVGYTAAALSKYNSAFFDGSTSCATAISQAASLGLVPRFEGAPVWAIPVAIVETSMPIMLAIPRTRRHAVRIGLVFHFVLSASPAFAVVDFTAALFALFIIFLSDEDVDNMLTRISKVASRSAIVRDARRKPPVTAVLAVLVFGFLGHLSYPLAVALGYVAAQIYFVAVLLAALFTWRLRTAIRPFGRLMLIQVPAVLLLVVWVASPYLGFRTSGVFTMFSGLKTEGDQANHLFLPTYDVVDWQDELVVIESVSDSGEEELTEGEVALPLMALRRIAHENPDLVVKGTIDGEKVTFGPEEGMIALEPLPWWQYKLFLFRPIGVDEHPFC